MSRTPSYRCVTEVTVTLDSKASFVQVEFSNGLDVTGPADATLTVELT